MKESRQLLARDLVLLSTETHGKLTAGIEEMKGMLTARIARADG